MNGKIFVSWKYIKEYRKDPCKPDFVEVCCSYMFPLDHEASSMSVGLFVSSKSIKWMGDHYFFSRILTYPGWGLESTFLEGNILFPGKGDSTGPSCKPNGRIYCQIIILTKDIKDHKEIFSFKIWRQGQTSDLMPKTHSFRWKTRRLIHDQRPIDQCTITYQPFHFVVDPFLPGRRLGWLHHAGEDYKHREDWGNFETLS